MNKPQSKTITIGPARVTHQSLAAPYSKGGNGEEQKYKITVLIPKTDLTLKSTIDSAIESVAQEALHTKWNGAAPVTLLTPLHDGDGPRSNGEAFGPECAGCYVMTANSKEKPEIVDANLQPIMNPGEIYRGVWVYLSVTFFAYMRSGKKGIGCILGPVMKYRDDEPLGGQISAKKAFSELMKPAVLDESSAPFLQSETQ